MTTADSRPRTHVDQASRPHRDRAGRRTRTLVLVPAVAAAVLVGGVVVADAATTTTGLSVCLQRGAQLVAPTSTGRCPKGYTLTRVVGARGPAGATGATGAAGATGPTGPSGAAGAQGPAGAAGQPGAAGPSGATGPAGAEGPAGATGPIGLTGPTGLTGAAGADGQQGPAGAPGAAGAAGAAGEQGPQGPEGPAGPDGPAGPQGVAGPQGSTGPAGPAGPTGAAGPAGADGVDGTGPAWLDTGDATVFTASDTHTLAGVTLPAGTYVLNASVFVNDAIPFETVATIQCSLIVAGDDQVLTPSFPTVASPQVQLIQDMVTLPSAVVSVSGASSPVSLRCTVVDEGGGFTLTGTVLALRVSSATVT